MVLATIQDQIESDSLFNFEVKLRKRKRDTYSVRLCADRVCPDDRLLPRKRMR